MQKKAIPDSTSDIIVVGAGPAGLSFCRALAGSGLKVTVFEPLGPSLRLPLGRQD